MKRIHFFNCFKIDDAVKSALNAFNKEAGYPVQGNTNKEQEPERGMNFYKSKKPPFSLVKLLAIVKNIFL
jgi:hypothetical protein